MSEHYEAIIRDNGCQASPFFFKDGFILRQSSLMKLGVWKMSKFYIKWRINRYTIPTNPEEMAKLWMTLLEWVRAEKKAGLFEDWGACCDSGSGYTIAEGDEVSLHSSSWNISRISPSTSSRSCLSIKLSNRLKKLFPLQKADKAATNFFGSVPVIEGRMRSWRPWLSSRRIR